LQIIGSAEEIYHRSTREYVKNVFTTKALLDSSSLYYLSNCGT